MNDILAAESFIAHVLQIGKEATSSIKEAVAIGTDEQLTFDDSDDTCLKVSLTILGFSLAALRSGSPMMDPKNAAQIAELCKEVFRTRFGIPLIDADDICSSIDVLSNLYLSSMQQKESPIGKAIVPLLRRCLGSDFEKVTMTGSQIVNPFVGDMVADLLLISLSNSLSFWKDRVQA